MSAPTIDRAARPRAPPPFLTRRGDLLLLLTLGADAPSCCATPDSRCTSLAPLASPVDTTGAGDTFTGCFLAAWINGIEPALALRFAVHGASRSIEFQGAQEHGLRAGDLLQAGFATVNGGRIV